MGSRYSDRFFGPEAAPGAEEPPRGHSIGGSTAHQPPPGDWIDDQRRPRRRWRAYRLVAAAGATGLVVGVAIGAYGWEQRRDREADTLARSTLDVRTEASVNAMNDRHEMTLSVRVHNDGAYPITLSAFTPVDDRLVPLGEVFEATRVAPRDDDVSVLHFGLACERGEQGAATDEVAVQAEVRTIDGRLHETDVRATAYGESLDVFLTEWCDPLPTPTFVEVELDIVAVAQGGTDAVATTVDLYYIHLGGDQRLEVLDVASPSAAFAVSWDDVVNDDPATGNARIVARWSVRDCELALASTEADITLQVSGRLNRDDPAATTSVIPSAISARS